MAHDGISAMKILFYDIEKSPHLMAGYRLYDQNFSQKQIAQHGFLICFSYCWEGEKIRSVSVLDDPKRYKKNHADDYYVVMKLSALIDSADAIVAHNGDKFDYKELMARIAYHRLPPIKKPILIDTLKMARQFGFTSRKLDDLAEHLGLPRKIHTDTDLGKRVAMGDRKAVHEMVNYCRADIPPLVALYERLKPYVGDNLNRGHYKNGECCPKCGSESFQKRGYRHTKAGKYQSYQCMECFGWFSSKNSIRNVVMR